MKKLLVALLSVGTLLSASVLAELDNPGGIGGLESLRGATNLEDTRPADDFKNTRVSKRWNLATFISHLLSRITFVVTRSL